MVYLIAASILWAFSFGLIGQALQDVSPFITTFVRLFLSLLVFLPFFRPRSLRGAMPLWLLLIGTVQYGLMYMAYIAAFRYLASHEIALLTVFTPIYVVLIHDLTHRRFHPIYGLTALAAVAATGLMVYRTETYTLAWRGFALIQASNLCFALGQVGYTALMNKADHSKGSKKRRARDDAAVFTWLYLGALLSASWPAARVVVQHGVSLSTHEMGVLLYLGLVPSGIGFFLWNAGARRVNAGTLAVMNNLKIPLAVLVSLVVFKEEAHAQRLTGGILVLALCLAVTIGKPFTYKGFRAGGANRN